MADFDMTPAQKLIDAAAALSSLIPAQEKTNDA